ncbi:YccS family putative transporter [Neisseria zoodegmatis]|uniref:Integral membrane protein n=1 Tax=Neisseria zoodegmatis TaxID=326523 RepID=A0AB38DM83_9NEIS|nr:YccS family putative transporter [Neisseria zoodegmatis]OSI10169.1 TIGR01666 family membrane protein [Neisseria zoodegmatis]SNU78557.1 integral membrane protein [Neisseria zoodegmatis]
MRTPAVNPKVIATLPVFFSVFIATTLIWYFDVPKLTTPFVLGIIAGGLVDLDNRLTGRLKNIVITLVLFSVSSLAAQFTHGSGLPFILVMTLLTFVFTLLGAVGLRYRTLAFGALAVATYTTLAYTPAMPWFVNPVLILCGTLLYSMMTLVLHIIFPHRPVQENMASAYAALGGYLDAKAAFFDPDEADWLESRQIDLAMKNTEIIEVFNHCRNALFYRMRGQHRHPRTMRMLRYYFTAQDIHERISSAHVDYRELAERLKNTDLIFRINRLLELQGQACRDVAESLRSGHPYQYSKRLERAIQGCRQSLKVYAERHNGSEVHTLQRLLENLFSVDYQLSHIESGDQTADEGASDKTRIAAMESGGLRNVWRTVRSQLNFESAVFRHAVRLAIVVFTACSIVEIFHLHMGYWILLTALFVCQPNYSATKSRIYQRIAGTLLGVVVGSLVPYFTPSVETKLWIVLAATTLFFFFRTNKYSFSTFFITVQALTAMSLAGEDVFALTWTRFTDTLAGTAIAWVAVSYLWPDWRYLTLSRTAGKAVNRNGQYLRHILGQLQTGGSDDVAYRVVRRQAHEAAAALSSTLSDMSGEPEKYGSKLQDGFNLLKLSYALIGYISALGAYRSQMVGGCAPEFTAGFFQTANQIADMLETLATASPEAFQTALAQIKQGLQHLHGLIGEDRQSSILWQQLSLIARQLDPCYTALHGSVEGTPAVSAQAV